MSKDRLETCKICLLSIDIEKEHHLILDEKRGNELIEKSYYHANCFREKFLVQKQMKQYLNQASQMFNNLGGLKV